jgi:hypothetical protein
MSIEVKNIKNKEFTLEWSQIVIFDSEFSFKLDVGSETYDIDFRFDESTGNKWSLRGDSANKKIKLSTSKPTQGTFAHYSGKIKLLVSSSLDADKGYYISWNLTQGIEDIYTIILNIYSKDEPSE